MDDVSGSRVVVVTGASSGVGLAAAREFARRGDEVVLIGRDADRLAAARAAVREESGTEPAAYRADFAVLDEVRALAERLRAEYPAIQALANNAGAIVHRRRITVDDFELTMQANHLAPFLLTNLLRDRLAGGRVVLTSSAVHAGGAVDPTDLRGQRHRYRAMRVYASSKQANVLFAAEAARRWPEVLTTSYHPGIVRTRFGTGNPMFALFYRVVPFLQTPAQGADTLVWLATAPVAEITNGGYYVRRGLRSPARNALDQRLAAQLWEASREAVGLT
jgi:NAD(P)-dependent dehydrogenase (short-subunit alcohol dehydrogenase family)